MKKTACIILSLILMISFAGCSFFGTAPLEIESGFSDKMMSLLSERYELSIPDSAVFIKGYFDRAFRDQSLIVSFTVDSDELEEMFVANWEKLDNPQNYTGSFGSEFDFEPVGGYAYQKELYTYLLFTENGNGTLSCYFTGRHPNTSFK